MQTIRKALNHIIQNVPVQPSEVASLLDALGRILAEDIKATFDFPSEDIATVDGFAVLMHDVMQPPVSLIKVGESTITSPYKAPISHGETVLVYSGAIVPPGCQTIIPHLYVEKEGNHIFINCNLPENQYISVKGLDFKKNDLLLNRGDLITPRSINLASILKIPYLPIRRKPRIGIISTGSELTMIGETPHKIIASSNYALQAAFKTYGAEPVNLGIINDDPESIKKQMDTDNRHNLDLLVTTGGLSLSSHNLMLNSLIDAGSNVELLHIAIGRGETILCSVFDHITVISLPGNPASTLICSELLIKPTIEHMLGMPTQGLKTIPAILGRKLDVYDKQANFLHATLTYSDKGYLVASPVSGQDTLLSSSLYRANCLIAIGPDSNVEAGTIVEVIPFTGSSIEI